MYMENDTEEIEKLKENAKSILQLFDNTFHTKTLDNFDYYFSKLIMLQKVYEYFEEDFCRSNPKYKDLRKTHIEITDMLIPTLSKAQNTIFENHLDIGSQMVSVECEQMFYMGYIMSKTLDQNIIIENKQD